MMRTFDERSHSYTMDGRKLPSVTQIINRVCPREWRADEWALNRGRQVHAAMSMYLRGVLDMDSLDPRIVGRVNAAILACRDFGWRAELIEERMAHGLLGFAGTPDAVMAGAVVVDWKGTPLDGAVGVQLGLYSILCEENGVKVKRLIGVHTRDDGSYRHEDYKVTAARADAVHFLGVYKWMMRNNKGEV
jgi:hypothetical protein